MKKIALLLFIVLIAISGCTDDEKLKPNTSHPDKGGVILTMDWSEVESDIPSTYKAYIVYESGKDTLFDNLGGASNNLVVEPGKAMLYVYNEAEHIHVEGGKATIENDGEWITANPGLFYSFSTEIFTEPDKDINQVALMTRQTGELKFIMALRPEHLVDQLKSITAVLEGVTSGLDLQTGEISTPYNIQMNFEISGNFAISNVRSLGFTQQKPQRFYITINNNGYQRTDRNDITSLLSTFNESRNTLLTLYSSLIVYETAGFTYPIWDNKERMIFANPNNIEFPPLGDTSYIVSIIADQPTWKYSVIGDWLTVSKSDSNLMISATPNIGNRIRYGRINLVSGYESDEITVTQNNLPENDIYKDSESVKLQSATVGKGINLVLMGDGYTLKDMLKETGKYEQDMRAAAEHFFSVYPFFQYRNYFNVYMIAAISNEEGISVLSPRINVYNKFNSFWYGEGSTYITCNDVTVRSYVKAIPELSSVNIHDLTVIMPINANIFAGTTYMYRDEVVNDSYGNGFSISLCPVGVGFKEVLVHEAGGHGFAKVRDEYIDNPNETIPESERNAINVQKMWGWYENVDFYDDILQTSWNGFAGQSKYSMVGTFEGAGYYGKGIWRPEANSCMNNNILYFNAPTRWAQIRRIYRLAGINYSFSQFLQDDKIPEYPANTRSNASYFIPLAPPVIK